MCDATLRYAQQGGKAEIIEHSTVHGTGCRIEVRQFTVSELTHYEAGPSPCVRIGFLATRRRWDSICVNPDSYQFWTIERDGQVLYDSRSDIATASSLASGRARQ